MEMHHGIPPTERTCIGHMPLIFPHTSRRGGFIQMRTMVGGKREFRAVLCSPDAIRQFWRSTNGIATVRAEVIRMYQSSNAAFQAGIFDTLRAGAAVYTDDYAAADSLAFMLNRIAEGSINVTDAKIAEDGKSLEKGNIMQLPDGTWVP